MATALPAHAQELGRSTENGEQVPPGGLTASIQSEQVVPVSEPASHGHLLNTSALDGLRAFAVFHIVLGHHSIYTNWTGQKLEDWSAGGGDGFSDGFDLLGGVSMGLFYVLSGFVLMIGYGNDDNEPNNCRSCLCCCNCCDCCCKCMCVESQPGARTPGAFNSRTFYWKRFARLGPLWYLGNFLAVHLFLTNYWWVGPPERWWPGFALMLFPLGLNSWFMHFPPAGHLWAISTMTFFYLMFPKLYYRVRRIQPHMLRSFAMILYGIQAGMMLVSGVGLGIIDPRIGYWVARAWPINRLPVFAMGLCGARQCQLEAIDPTLNQMCGSFEACGMTKCCKIIVLLLIYFFVILLGIAEQLVGGPGFIRFLGEVVLPVLFYELITALVYPAHMAEPPSRLHQLLGCRILRFLAHISLAVYVVHETLIRSFALAYRGPVELLPDGSMPKDVDIRMTPWGTCIILPLSVFMGWFLTRFYEKPMSKAILKWALRSSPT